MTCINHQLTTNLDSQFNTFEILEVVIILKEFKMYFLNIRN